MRTTRASFPRPMGRRGLASSRPDPGTCSGCNPLPKSHATPQPPDLDAAPGASRGRGRSHQMKQLPSSNKSKAHWWRHWWKEYQGRQPRTGQEGFAEAVRLRSWKAKELPVWRYELIRRFAKKPDLPPWPDLPTRFQSEFRRTLSFETDLAKEYRYWPRPDGTPPELPTPTTLICNWAFDVAEDDAKCLRRFTHWLRAERGRRRIETTPSKSGKGGKSRNAGRRKSPVPWHVLEQFDKSGPDDNAKYYRREARSFLEAIGSVQNPWMHPDTCSAAGLE